MQIGIGINEDQAKPKPSQAVKPMAAQQAGQQAWDGKGLACTRGVFSQRAEH